MSSPKPLVLNVTPEWVRRMADAEDACGGIFSVGGLACRVEDAERARLAAETRVPPLDPDPNDGD